jgi:hypothetical protein
MQHFAFVRYLLQTTTNVEHYISRKKLNYSRGELRLNVLTQVKTAHLLKPMLKEFSLQ